jgi:uncharacterized protein YjiS (DUF1127 family)
MTTLTFAPTFSFSRFGTGIGHALLALRARLQEARRLRETRRYLEQMDDHMLSDLGVSRAQARFDLENTRWSRQ